MENKVNRGSLKNYLPISNTDNSLIFRKLRLIKIFNCMVTENATFVFLKERKRKSRNGGENNLDNNWKRTIDYQFLFKLNSSETL